MAKVSVVILAAGAGTRLKQNIPKPLVPLLGKPCVLWLWSMLQRLGIKDIVTVIHPSQKADYDQYTSDYEGHFAYQNDRLGTAHAALIGIEEVNHETVIVINGDTPCLPSDMIAKLMTMDFALVGFKPDVLTGYGIIQAEGSVALGIHEEVDVSEGIANAGIYKMPSIWAKENIPKIQPSGSKGELWITALIASAYEQNMPFELCVTGESWEYEGINTVAQWVSLESKLNAKMSTDMISHGVYLQDPSSISWSADMTVAPGVRIGRGCVFEGSVQLDENVVIEPYCVIKSSHLHENVVVKSFTRLTDADVDEHTSIGPFAHLDQVVCGKSSNIGNFVEVKRSNLGDYNKAKHLSYLGDVTSGMGLNVGAGAIICNYDGRNKHPCVIGHGVFIGSNVTLISPMVVGSYAIIAAGSVVSKRVDESMLTIARSEVKVLAYSMCRYLKDRWSKIVGSDPVK